MDVPRMTIVLPLRSRLQFTTNALPSLVRHSSRAHEIILVLDKTPYEYELTRRSDVYPRDDIPRLISTDKSERENVYRWIDAHGSLLDKHGIQVMEFMGDERRWTGGLRAAAAMNMAMKAATSDWVLTFGDESLFFMKNWDLAMWTALRDHDPMQFVALPVMVTSQLRDPYPNLTPSWIHAQRGSSCHQLTFPLARQHTLSLTSGRLSYESFLRFFEMGKMTGCVNERCGDRRMCHWMPMVMNRKLFDRVGGYPTGDQDACSYDLTFDDTLRRLGVTKRMPLDHMILLTQHYVHFSDDADREWGDTDLLASIGPDTF
jgi:hypothetical protein